MVIWCYVLASALGAVVFLYGILEIHYFLRMCLCVFLARYMKKKSHIMDTTIVTGVCLTNDIDTLLYHMNNARYLRELDFARVDFYERTKLYQTILAKGGAVVQGAATIRYRRFIRPFSLFRITSKVVYWDDQSLYMEHRFISIKDEFIHCVAICRQRFLNCSVDEIMAVLLCNNNTSVVAGPQNSTTQLDVERIENVELDVAKFRPELPPDIAKWIECNDISSKTLRNGC